MGFVPANGVIKVELVYNQNGQVTENVLNFLVPDANVEATAWELAPKIVNWFDTHMKSAVPPTTSLVKLILSDASDENGYRIEYTTSLPIAGTATGATAPNNVTAAVKFNTAYRGRGYHGRAYIPGMTANNFSNNTLVSGMVSALIAAFEELLSIPMTAGAAELCVVSKWLHKAQRILAVVTPVLSITCESTVDSQRRRLPGRGK